MDDTGQYIGDLYCERDRGLVAQRGQKVVIGDDHKGKVVGSVGDPAELLAKWKKYEWNDYDILARGNHIVLRINGHVTVDVTDNDMKMRRFEGIIALQLHAGDPMKVQFRNLRLKELPSSRSRLRGGTGVRAAAGPRKKIVFFAGSPSHPYAEHEYYAGCRLLANWLHAAVPNAETVVCKESWPDQELGDADAIVLFCDGVEHHPILPHLDQMDQLISRGVGLACIHWSVDLDKGQGGRPHAALDRRVL